MSGSRDQQASTRDLSHRLFNGVEVLRALRQHVGDDVLMPVVFTSTLGLSEEAAQAESRDALEDTFGRVGYAISQTPQVWLDHQLKEEKGGLQYNWDSVESLFEPALLDAMFACWEQLLLQLATEPECWQSTGPLTLPESEQATWQALNATKRPWPDIHQATLLTDLLTQAEQTPEACAVICGNEQLTYKALLQQAQTLAGHLRGQGVEAGQPVALYLEKGHRQIISTLAVLWLGAYYVPLNTEWPVERIKAILSQLDKPCLLTDSAL